MSNLTPRTVADVEGIMSGAITDKSQLSNKRFYKNL